MHRFQRLVARFGSRRKGVVFLLSLGLFVGWLTAPDFVRREESSVAGSLKVSDGPSTLLPDFATWLSTSADEPVPSSASPEMVAGELPTETIDSITQPADMVVADDSENTAEENQGAEDPVEDQAAALPIHAPRDLAPLEAEASSDRSDSDSSDFETSSGPPEDARYAALLPASFAGGGGTPGSSSAGVSAAPGGTSNESSPGESAPPPQNEPPPEEPPPFNPPTADGCEQNDLLCKLQEQIGGQIDSMTHVPGRLVAQFAGDSTGDEIDAILDQIDGRILECFSINDYCVVEVPLDSDIPTVAKQLATRPGVLSAQPDFLREAAGIAIDPLYPLQWSLNMIKAPQAWDEMMLIGGARPKVAVLDTGFDTLHPDLILVWSTTINALNDHPTNRDDVSDNPDHGTKVTGALAALGDNAYGIAGVNKDWADLILVKVFGAKVNGKDVTSDTLVMKGISLLPTETRVVNLSLAGAGPRPSALCDAIASRSDLLFVAAAGNNHDENPYYPAACGSENLIAVASSNSSDTLAQSSNWGLWVDLAAPGVGIWTTTPYSLFGSVDGTSMAAPHVSGVASMIFSKTPSMSPSAVRNQIRNTVDDYKHLEVSTGGRLNACRALGGC